MRHGTTGMRQPTLFYNGNYNPAGTWRLYNVGSTSMQRHDVASTLSRRCINVMCLLGSMVASLKSYLPITATIWYPKIPFYHIFNLFTIVTSLQWSVLCFPKGRCCREFARTVHKSQTKEKQSKEIFINCKTRITKTCLFKYKGNFTSKNR